MKLLPCWIVLLLALSASAQRKCLVQYNPATVQSLNVTSNQGRDTLPNEVITVPVVIHILYNGINENISDAAVRSQIDILNKDFRKLNSDVSMVPPAFAPLTADARINFCIARVDPHGRPTSGIVHKHTTVQNWTADDAMKYASSGGDDAWDSQRYLNIWVCNLFGRNLGYAAVPGGPATVDGVVIQYDVFGTIGSSYPFNKGRTATHEIGHWLGLKHLWADADCGDDGIADTPPQQTYNNGCPTFPHTSTCSVNNNGDMFMNFMDFTDDACMHMFSRGQVSKMRSQFALNGYRNSFLFSSACDSALAQGAALPTDSIPIVTNIKIFPNPAVNQVNINCNTSWIIGKTIRIYNILGMEVLTGKLLQQNNSIQIASLTSGMYVVRIGDDTDVRTIRFMKQ